VHYDFVIVGSGIAGLYTTLQAASYGRVLLVTKSQIQDGNTWFAQGGIAAAIGPTDRPLLHCVDTITAGAGLCEAVVAKMVAEEGPDRIKNLVDLGVPFDTIDEQLALTMEGAHSIARVLHAGGDATGANIASTLATRVKEAGADILEHRLVTNINPGPQSGWHVRLFDYHDDQKTEISCNALVLATGGSGQLFKFNTNPSIATADGVALAYRAGAEVMDLEFFQFHPTALHIDNAPSFLISEALRGEGGMLRNADGYRFMPDYDDRAELACRDVVARAILNEMNRSGSDCVFLDMTHLPSRVITQRFPNIHRYCLEYGIDITATPIPVAPAAHYMMGGIRTGLWGETTLPGLYACGEVACTSLHGANRLASNSLIEALVFGPRIVEHARLRQNKSPLPHSSQALQRHFPEITQNSHHRSLPPLADLQDLMWKHMGIIRYPEGLQSALSTLNYWQSHLPVPNSRATHELSNMLLVGQLMTEAAWQRQESRGAHYRADAPNSHEHWAQHIIFRR
jgi:L-aspartate oxidase